MASTSSPSPTARRREAVRAEIVAGGVSGPREVAERLAERGIDAAPAEVRGDLRALGAIRVAGVDGPVLAVPVEREAASAPSLADQVVADPDWKLQTAVAALVAVLVLVGVLGWLLGP